MFQINKNSQSFKFLSRYDSDFKRLNRAITKEPERVADPYDTLWWYIPKTFCDYYKKVAKYALLGFGIGWAIIIPILGILFMVDGWTNTYFFANLSVIGVLAFLGLIVDILAAAGGLGFLLAGAGFFVYEFITEKLESRKPMYPKSRQPGFIKTAYKSWKEKFCPIVTYNLVDTKDESHDVQDQ